MNDGSTPEVWNFDLPDGAWMSYGKGWLEKATADRLFSTLRAGTWESRSVVLRGKPIQQPRLVSWMSEPPGKVYRYSGVDNVGSAMSAPVREIKDLLWHTDTGLRAFNACFLNLYRNEHDSIGYHSDDEPIFGENPVIASVSLGAMRRFKIQHKITKDVRELKLDHGDLLVMGGTFQNHYLHSVPKEGRQFGERINLTFRHLIA